MNILEDYLEERKEYAESFGFRVKTPNVDHKMFAGGFKARGYFCESTKVIFLAKAHPDFLMTAIHEYCHFDQWLNQTKEWVEFDRCVPVQSFGDFTDMSYPLEISEQKEAIAAIVNLEMDCERRVVRQIMKYDLPIDVGEYVQRANAYGFFHVVLSGFRGLDLLENPYRLQSVYKMMPKYFVSDFSSVPDEFLLRCRQHCYSLVR